LPQNQGWGPFCWLNPEKIPGRQCAHQIFGDDRHALRQLIYGTQGAELLLHGGGPTGPRQDERDGLFSGNHGTGGTGPCSNVAGGTGLRAPMEDRERRPGNHRPSGEGPRFFVGNPKIIKGLRGIPGLIRDRWGRGRPGRTEEFEEGAAAGRHVAKEIRSRGLARGGRPIPASRCRCTRASGTKRSEGDCCGRHRPSRASRRTGDHGTERWERLRRVGTSFCARGMKGVRRTALEPRAP